MLENLSLKHVGPADAMNMNLAPRVNLITGDNGLGKSFLLDVAWWALTRTWARRIVVPHAHPTKPQIAYSYSKKSGGDYEYTSVFKRATDQWTVKNSRPAIPGLVLYAQVDGGFSVWDPERNYWRKELPDRPAAYLFKPDEVWKDHPHCEGLIRDWASWQREDGAEFRALKSVLKALSPSDAPVLSPTDAAALSPSDAEALSPSDAETLRPGRLRKVTLDDPIRYPTLAMPYGEDVAIIHASAGMRRIAALAYLVVWAWFEHLASAKLRGGRPAREIIFLIDEIESHLHPQWQRRIVPALLSVMEVLTGEHDAKVQLITATHSPLVLASMEPWFHPQRDAWFDMDLQGTPPTVQLQRRVFTPRGTAGHWLTSEAFDMKTDRGSVEAERAILAARALLRQEAPALEEVMAAHGALRRVLPDVDRFWVRWNDFVERCGGQP